MEKTNVKLSGIVLAYLLVVVALLGAVTIVAVIVFNNMTPSRADDTENQVEAWIDMVESDSEINMASFPKKADYVLESDGQEISSSISNINPKKMEEYITSYKTYGQEKYLEGQEVYIAKTIGESTIYIHYSLGVPGEWMALSFIVLAYILVIIIPSVILISKLKKFIYKLAEEKWRKEYETKQEMAQIAHDLKTPLTVIRGNADLLLEKDQDDDSKESIEAIISNAERIARSVLEILEKES
ncbi:His Kinase A (phospho-acceptor) domain-containing protein [Pseudobutyrivibrio sp. YE44]|uniref:histidine kinase dimerization/phospho-acceptor domain-containing protein n=1 Tax=Pseudobutyrivibrio sp. YE44 TaxID=1520802 RepID=UPI000888F8FF|nr:histidine kinase dimerization/phospho-acceptor domain-containing protein [Pseudobutyrivibrio sp. YE44]SDB12897.1 His Kinase A (phospho-acceptor) domain-containing protein [Pseudobutyrivibrio sp. YE44]